MSRGTENCVVGMEMRFVGGTETSEAKAPNVSEPEAKATEERTSRSSSDEGCGRSPTEEEQGKYPSVAKGRNEEERGTSSADVRRRSS